MLLVRPSILIAALPACRPIIVRDIKDGVRPLVRVREGSPERGTIGTHEINIRLGLIIRRFQIVEYLTTIENDTVLTLVLDAKTLTALFKRPLCWAAAGRQYQEL